jgi:hypothetical protein
VKEDELGETCNKFGRDENSYRILVGNLKGKGHLGDTDMDGRII